MQTFRKHLASVTRFSGRETRSEFWPYAALVLGLIVLITFAVMVSAYLKTVSKLDRFAAEHPELVYVRDGQELIKLQGHPELMPIPIAWATGTLLAAVLSVALLGSAVVRRLHDVGRSGLWGALPLPFLLAGWAHTKVLLSSAYAPGTSPITGPGMTLIWLMNTLVYYGTLVFLFRLVVLPGSEEPNEHGVGLRSGRSNGSA